MPEKPVVLSDWTFCGTLCRNHATDFILLTLQSVADFVPETPVVSSDWTFCGDFVPKPCHRLHSSHSPECSRICAGKACVFVMLDILRGLCAETMPQTSFLLAI